MMEVRPANARGHANHGWLDSYHTFSFADYYDPQEIGFGPLRVINEDRVQPGAGFGTHAHRDMEIVTYVLEGALQHQDSMGNGSLIRPGDVQRMSAGRGIRHSEFNGSHDEPVHFLQIWIEPSVSGIEPSYEQKQFPDEAKRGKLCLVASSDSRDASLHIHQDADVYAALIDGEESITYRVAVHRLAYVHVARGTVSVNGEALIAGDGVKITGPEELTLDHAQRAEILLFDLPPA